MTNSRVSAEDRREQLIDATIEMMKCTGVQSLTLRSIAKEAGASLAAVHYCFHSKEELLHAALKRWLSNMISYANDIPIANGLRATVLAFTDAYWSELEEVPEDVLAQIELVVWSARQDDSQDLGGIIYPGYVAELGAIFESAMAHSAELITVSTEDLTRALLVIIDGSSLQYISQPDNPNHGRLFRLLVDGLLNNIGLKA